MKLGNLFFVSIVALCSVACSNEEKLPTLTDFVGTYEGYTLAGCAYFQNSCMADETVRIAENSDGSANITFISQSWGEFSIPNAQTSNIDGICTIIGNGQTQMGMNGITSSYDCTYTAIIKNKEDAKMQFKIPGVMGGLTIDFIRGEAPLDLLFAGTYKGYTDADCAYFQDRYTNDESLKMTSNGDGTLAVIFESDTWGTFNVLKANVTKSGNDYKFTGNGTVSMGMESNKKDYAFTMTGTINTMKDSFSIIFNTPAVMGGLTITLLPGNAPSATEK